MNAFNYSAAAVLFCDEAVKGRQKPLTFRRLTQAAEGVRYAIEALPAYVLGSCSLEVEEER